MIGDSWTHKIARICVLPLINTSISPNHITVIRLITGLLACAAFASKLNIIVNEINQAFSLQQIKEGGFFVVIGRKK